MPEKFDYIFAGFGLSGMSLFYELSKDPDFVKKNVLIIDRDSKKENDRTWSFWANESNDFLHLAKQSWKKGLFFDEEGKKIHLNLEDYTYYTIEGLEFYNFINLHVAKFRNVTRIQEKISNVSVDGYVKTQENEYSGELVFKSYFEKIEFQLYKSNYFVWQHFYGYVIRTKEDKFNPREFTLMDYSFTDKIKTNFFYILPYSKTEALIEFTEFSQKLYTETEYKEKLEEYISKHLGIIDYETVLVEFNAIPMTDFQLNSVVSKNVINIGSLAGYVKPSSGYAFTRTLARNKKLVELITSRQNLEERMLNSSKTYKAFDNAVLYLIANEKVHGGRIFASLFRQLNTDFVFQFLDEKLNYRELLKIMLASPSKFEFIKYFIKKRGK